MKKALIFIFLGLMLIITYLFITRSDEANKIQDFKLQNIPSEIFVGKNKDTFFLYDNGDLCSVEIIDNKLKFEKAFENIVYVSFERENVALVDKNNTFSFAGSYNVDTKKLFSNIVNIKAEKEKIVKITSGDNFTSVLFENGDVYSDINFVGENIDIQEQSCYLFQNIKDISSGRFHLLALDEKNFVHTLVPSAVAESEKTVNSTRIDGAIRVYAGDLKSYVHTQNGEIFSLINDQIFSGEKPEVDVFRELSDIGEITVGFNGSVMLAYSKNRFIYHWGQGYTYKNKIKAIPEIVTPEIVFEDNNVKLFKGTYHGIFVITNDGTLRIIKN